MLLWSSARLGIADAKHYVLPFRWLVPFGFVGLAWAAASGILKFGDAVLGGAIATLMLASVAIWHQRRSGADGLGFGDIVLGAAIGIWVGAAAAAIVVTIGALLGLATAFVRTASGLPCWPIANPHSDKEALPFGLFLCVAVVGFWFWALPGRLAELGLLQRGPF